MSTNSPDFLTVKEFAFKAGAHPNTIRRGIKNGKINAFKIGVGKRSHFRISKNELERIALFSLEEIIERLITNRRDKSL